MELLKKQREYFLSGTTRDVDFRIEKLIQLKESIIKNEKDIAEALKKDLNKAPTESYVTETGMILEEIKYALKNIKSWVKPEKVKTPLVQFRSQSYIYSEPYGLSLIIGTWNYPFLLCFSPLIGAIAAGNCAIVKPSEVSPNCSRVISKIIEETFDEKHVKSIEGGVEIATELLNQKFDYILYTGGINVGKIVMQAASKNLTPVTLELGGKSPCIVDRDVDINVAARRIVWGKLLNAGQICIAPDYLYVNKGIKEELIKKIKKSIIEFFGKDSKQSPDYPRIVNQKHFDRLVNFIDKSKVIIGGDYDRENLYISPTVLDNVNWEDAIMQEEIFGPILPIMEYNDLDEVINIINDHPKPLALYLFSDNKDIQQKVIDRTSSGGVCINSPIHHQVSPSLPFGGVGDSGMGNYHGKFSFDTFSHKKSVVIKSFFPDIKTMYPPYKGKLKLLRNIWG